MRALLVLILLAMPVHAETKMEFAEVPNNCRPRSEMISFLTQRFGETLRGAGTSRDGHVELWHSPGGRTWTILLVMPNGLLCALSFGEGWLRR